MALPIDGRGPQTSGTPDHQWAEPYPTGLSRRMTRSQVKGTSPSPPREPGEATGVRGARVRSPISATSNKQRPLATVYRGEGTGAREAAISRLCRPDHIADEQFHQLRVEHLARPFA